MNNILNFLPKRYAEILIIYLPIFKIILGIKFYIVNSYHTQVNMMYMPVNKLFNVLNVDAL